MRHRPRRRHRRDARRRRAARRAACSTPGRPDRACGRTASPIRGVAGLAGSGTERDHGTAGVGAAQARPAHVARPQDRRRRRPSATRRAPPRPPVPTLRRSRSGRATCRAPRRHRTDARRPHGRGQRRAPSAAPRPAPSIAETASAASLRSDWRASWADSASARAALGLLQLGDEWLLDRARCLAFGAEPHLVVGARVAPLGERVEPLTESPQVTCRALVR